MWSGGQLRGGEARRLGRCVQGEHAASPWGLGGLDMLGKDTDTGP